MIEGGFGEERRQQHDHVGENLKQEHTKIEQHVVNAGNQAAANEENHVGHVFKGDDGDN